MLGWLERRRERKRLAPIAGAVPQLLLRSFGPAPHYTSAQVRTVAAKLKLSPELQTMALAVCCAEAAFVAEEPDRGGNGYRELRARLATGFDIDRPREHLLALRNVPTSNRDTGIADDDTGKRGGGIVYDPRDI